MKAVGQWMRFSDTASCFTVIVRGNDGEKERVVRHPVVPARRLRHEGGSGHRRCFSS